MNDHELDSLIRHTHPKPEFPASFQREVWARITVAEQRSWKSRFAKNCETMFLWIARPVPSLATVLLTIGIGVGAGSLSASGQTTALRSAYADSINPFKANALAMRP